MSLIHCEYAICSFPQCSSRVDILIQVSKALRSASHGSLGVAAPVAAVGNPTVDGVAGLGPKKESTIFRATEVPIPKPNPSFTT